MQNENGVLAVQEDFGNALVDKYAPVWDKKYRSKGESIWVFQRRTLSSACQVATTLHDMDFGKASTFLFHLVREAEECKPIIEAVSSQVELAMANPDKFIKGYHQFLQGLTKPIKKNKDYALYFKAIAYAQECVHSGLSIDGNVERNDSVLYAVIDMLMQGSIDFWKVFFQLWIRFYDIDSIFSKLINHALCLRNRMQVLELHQN